MVGTSNKSVPEMAIDKMLEKPWGKVWKSQDPWTENRVPGLVNIQKAIEAMAIEIVDLAMKNGSFHSY